jgi:hypothetical protein
MQGTGIFFFASMAVRISVYCGIFGPFSTWGTDRAGAGPDQDQDRMR